MKKTLAVLLSVLIAFSMFSIAASAASIQVVFVDRDGKTVLNDITLDDDQELTYEDFPEVEKQFTIETKNPDTGELEKYRYTLRGWQSSADDVIYYPGSFQLDRSEKIVVFSAVYIEENLSERQSFWEFVESIFERINLIFEYFATIFNF